MNPVFSSVLEKTQVLANKVGKSYLVGFNQWGCIQAIPSDQADDIRLTDPIRVRPATICGDTAFAVLAGRYCRFKKVRCTFDNLRRLRVVYQLYRADTDGDFSEFAMNVDSWLMCHEPGLIPEFQALFK